MTSYFPLFLCGHQKATIFKVILLRIKMNGECPHHNFWCIHVENRLAISKLNYSNRRNCVCMLWTIWYKRRLTSKLFQFLLPCNKNYLITLPRLENAFHTVHGPGLLRHRKVSKSTTFWRSNLVAIGNRRQIFDWHTCNSFKLQDRQGKITAIWQLFNYYEMPRTFGNITLEIKSLFHFCRVGWGNGATIYKRLQMLSGVYAGLSKMSNLDYKVTVPTQVLWYRYHFGFWEQSTNGNQIAKNVQDFPPRMSGEVNYFLLAHCQIVSCLFVCFFPLLWMIQNQNKHKEKTKLILMRVRWKENKRKQSCSLIRGGTFSIIDTLRTLYSQFMIILKLTAKWVFRILPPCFILWVKT